MGVGDDAIEMCGSAGLLPSTLANTVQYRIGTECATPDCELSMDLAVALNSGIVISLCGLGGFCRLEKQLSIAIQSPFTRL